MSECNLKIVSEDEKFVTVECVTTIDYFSSEGGPGYAREIVHVSREGQTVAGSLLGYDSHGCTVVIRGDCKGFELLRRRLARPYEQRGKRSPFTGEVYQDE